MEHEAFYAYMHPDDRRAVSTPQPVHFPDGSDGFSIGEGTDRVRSIRPPLSRTWPTRRFVLWIFRV
jgi:hypothetical protein